MGWFLIQNWLPTVAGWPSESDLTTHPQMELTLTEFVCLALGGSLALVLFAALLSRFFHSRGERHALARRVICRLCLHAFEDSSLSPIVTCPACRASTERRHRGNLG